MLYAAFNALRAVATTDADPAKSCKPFDKRRDGFVVAEGGAIMMLESEEHAKARGARIYAALAGYGSSNDAFDMVASDENGRGAVLAMEMALRKAGVERERIGYVNAHGTGDADERPGGDDGAEAGAWQSTRTTSASAARSR